MSNGLIALVVLVALAAGWALAVFNRLVRSRNRMNSAYARIDALLEQRHALIPELVATARGYLQHERLALQGVSVARQRATEARQALADFVRRPATSGGTGGSGEAAGGRSRRTELLEALDRSEAGLNTALGKFSMVVESYPELKADRTIVHINEKLAASETAIAASRQAFNDAVTTHNAALRQFPASLVANACGFTAADLLRSPTKTGERVPAMVHLP